MSITQHISELRNRMFVVAFVFAAGVIGGFFLAKPAIKFLQTSDEAKMLTLHAFKLEDPLLVYVQFAVIIGLVFASPVILYELWAFISPGLYEKERKITLSYIPMALLLFLGGISFSYYILFPFVVRFMTGVSNDMNIEQVIGIYEYFQFLMQLTLPFGLLFQLPIVVMFLTRLGLVTPEYLVKVRKYAYFILLVVAAFITPPDLMSHLLVTVPLLILYEISIIISRFAYRKAQQTAEIEKSAGL